MVDTGELKVRSWQEYRGACVKLLDALGRNLPVDDVVVEDFDKLRTRLSKGPKGKRSPVSLAKDIRLVRIVFKYAYDAALIQQPVRFGPNFKQLSKRVIRQSRQSNGPRMIEAEELWAILDNARQPLLPIERAQSDRSGEQANTVELWDILRYVWVDDIFHASSAALWLLPDE